MNIVDIILRAIPQLAVWLTSTADVVLRATPYWPIGAAGGGLIGVLAFIWIFGFDHLLFGDDEEKD